LACLHTRKIIQLQSIAVEENTPASLETRAVVLRLISFQVIFVSKKISGISWKVPEKA
jgi:hypothetical protein